MSKTLQVITNAVKPLVSEIRDNIPDSVKDFANTTVDAIKSDTKNLKEIIMSNVNLIKVSTGERYNLTKEVGEAVTNYSVALDWNASDSVDCDASIVVVHEDGTSELIFYNNTTTAGVKHYGDNRTGTDGEVTTPLGSDEQIDIDLSALAPTVKELILVGSTYSDGEPFIFGKASDPTMVLFCNGSTEVLSYEPSEDNSTATCVAIGRIYKHKGDWKFDPQGKTLGSGANGLEALRATYNF